MEQVKPSSEQNRTSATFEQSFPKLQRMKWLAERMATTLEMFPATSLSATAKKQHLAEWDLILCEVGAAEFDRALSEHIRESKFFPAVAELRERAHMKLEDRNQVESLEAWSMVLRWLKKWGWPGVREYAGKDDEGNIIWKYPPKLPARVDYAVRQVGGMAAISQRTYDSEPFMRKEFIEAYRLAPIEEHMRPQLESQFAPKELSAGMKQLMSGKAMNVEPRPAPIVAMPKPKLPEAPLTDEQWEQRQSELKKQVDQLREAK